MHLQIAEDIRRRVEDGDNVPLQQLLRQQWPAFYLGSVAADYQTICDIPRSVTHFYELPPGPDEKAYPAMLETHPELADAEALSPDRATFVAAYAVHLMLDLLWFRQVLMPFFVEASDWGDFPHRHLVHNILLAYLDKAAFEALPEGAATTLAAAQPEQWLPFASDTDLVTWRDVLVDQLRPGAALQTIEIYAERLRMSPREFADRLQDPAWIEEKVLGNVPVADVRAMFKAAIPSCILLITEYLHLN